jgi:hypothetical protein
MVRDAPASRSSSISALRRKSPLRVALAFAVLQSDICGKSRLKNNPQLATYQLVANLIFCILIKIKLLRLFAVEPKAFFDQHSQG